MNQIVSNTLAAIEAGDISAANAMSAIERAGGAAFLIAQIIDGLHCARSSADVTPDDDTNLPRSSSKGLTVNADGDLSLLFAGMKDDDTPVTRSVKAGLHYPWHVKRVLATGTTATGIAIYFD